MNDARHQLTQFATPTLFHSHETVGVSSQPLPPREPIAPKRSCSEACLPSDHIYAAHHGVTSSRPPPPREPIAPKRSCSEACLPSDHIYAAHHGVTSSRPPPAREPIAPKRSCSEACLPSDHIYAAHQPPPTTDGAHLLDCLTTVTRVSTK